jgi:uncharacterized membrane-anchored protein
MNRLNRVPEVTAYFWIIKVLPTTVGETAADYLAFTVNLGLSATSYLMSGASLIIYLSLKPNKQSFSADSPKDL